MRERHRHRRRWYLLLLVPYVGLLWPAWYAKAPPKLFGFPFFYWYQFAWVLGAALITACVWLLVRPRGDGRRRDEGAAPEGTGPRELAAAGGRRREP